MTIRDARPSDAERLLEIYAWYVAHTAVSVEYEVPTLPEFRERIGRTLRKYPWLVAEEDGRAVGYAYAGVFKGRAAYDWSCETSIYLDREVRGMGLGRALYGALEAELRSMGMLNLYACITLPEVEDEYLTLDSPRFHARLGYVQVGRFHRCGYKFNRWYDMIWMEKVIGEHGDSQAPVRPWRGGRADSEPAEEA